MKKCLITGVTGQDGSYLTEFLLEKGYEVHGLIRRSSITNTERIAHLLEGPSGKEKRLILHYGDICDSNALERIIGEVGPDEVYHLAAQSHVRVSFDTPIYTAETVALGTLRLLEAIRNIAPKSVRFYQASSSEMYGKALEIPQNEATPFRPQSPYACAKTYAHQQTINYREAYHIHASCGILFNHESPRRGDTFVTRKITLGVAKILAGLSDKIHLGNLEAKRDWGYAKDYVEAMWLMLQQDTPDDYVIATGEMKSVLDFLKFSFSCVGRNWEDYVKIDPIYYRPSEVDILQGDASKALKKLDWRPKTNFEDLVLLMLKHDLECFGLRSEDYLT